MGVVSAAATDPSAAARIRSKTTRVAMGTWHPRGGGGYHRSMADVQEQLQEIGAQLDWVRDYL
jgi:hypothetical protein